MKRLWFDTEEKKILSFDDMLKEYQVWLVEMVAEQGPDYVRENPRDFTFDQFVENCTTPWNGNLVEIVNGDEYMRRG